LLVAAVAAVGLSLVVAAGAGWAWHEEQLSGFRAELEVQTASLDAQAVQLDAQATALDAQPTALGVAAEFDAGSAQVQALEGDLDSLYWFVDELSVRQQGLEHIVRQASDFAAIEELLRNSVVQVETEFGQGSGFRLDLAAGCFDYECDIYEAEGYDTVIVTNYHVIAEMAGLDYEDRVVTVIGPDGGVAEGRVWDWDAEQDLALIDLDRSDLDRHLEALMWAPRDSVSIDDRVAIGGHPLGWEFVMTTGSLTGDRVDEWQTDALISGGSSGGPMVDSFGRVVGIAAESLGGITYAVDIYALGDVLVDC
jgi:S1-C subfamily serine protease